MVTTMEWVGTSESNQMPADPASAGGLVLVCDDAAEIRTLIRINLELEGYEVVEASDGQDALEILQDPAQPLPDVITLDALMPRRDGWWAVSMIRADPRLEAIPIIMVTASVQPNDRAQAEKVAVDGFMAKPFEPDELLALIGALAGRGRV
jgi:CheY-like chemotaxis protein